MQLPSLQSIKQPTAEKELPSFQPGDTISVHVRISEGDKQRIQVFEGVVMSVSKKRTSDATFTVRKVTNGIGVERTFLIYSPNVVKIDVKSMGKVRRAKLYYVRNLSVKKARIQGASRQEQAKRTGTISTPIKENKTSTIVPAVETIPEADTATTETTTEAVDETTATISQ